MSDHDVSEAIITTEPVPLSTPDGLVRAHACGACGRIWLEATPHMAIRCCQCGDCGVPLKQGRSRCDDCMDKQQRERLERQLANATLVDERTTEGMVVLPGSDDRYYDSTDELADDCECRDEPVPAYAFCTTQTRFILDGESILNSESESHHEDILDGLNGIPEFLAAVEAFNAANADNRYAVTHFEDTSRKVVVRAATADEPGEG